MRFSIRDSLWVTLVVAMALGWWLDNQTKHAAVEQAHRQRAILLKLSEMRNDPFAVDVDWGILDEPLVEP
jgi:hypothetical protein